ncbi:TPA: hypothetical protein O7963_002690 [Staphylococcus aureus]|nr:MULTISPECIES: hypothetical protein [Staphylococcus]ELP43412.1 hypothetical protein SA21282_0018 [Staphylococcus aureus subsp. aureus 21282]HDQ3544425.1 hypothetical protein [Staphylococcus aureus USA600-NY-315]NUI09660.1 hypothetical protein [Staphylococcus aureus]HCW8371899.1 hypothetical protein [Staphylococcus aureus]HCY3085225.1 hypothetical protein [Staphylococcus aureus]
MRKDDYKISIFYLNQSFFEEPCIVVISNDSKLKEIYNFRNIDIKYLSKHFTSYIYDSKKYVEEQSGLLDFNNYIYYTSIYYGKYIGTVILQNNLDLFFNYGKRLANDHYNTLISKSKERLINKAHDEIQPFNHLDLNSMKEIVDDITFSYQIEQGLQAYKRELYLPAAATFAVAIETFLIKLKKVNKIKHKDTDSTMYTKLLGELTKEGKVNYRTKKRVEIAYSMRNIINHSQAGAVAKGDCDFLLNTLKDIVDENEKILREYTKSINKTE